MPIVEYDPNDQSLLPRLAALLPPHHGLRFRDFVDYYYGTTDRCRLLLMLDEDGRILGTLGYEKMTFATPEGDRCFAHGSNFHAFEPGAGGLLFLHWLKNCDSGIVFGGNENTQRVIEHQRWPRYSSVETLQLNHAYADMPGESLWRSLTKQLLRRLPSNTRVDRRAASMLARDADVVEAVPETEFTQDMVPAESPFALRFAPELEHLNWRYRSGLDFVRYHTFRIVHAGETCGCVTFNEQQHRLILAHCDGNDPWVLTRGVFAALARLCRGRLRSCGVLLASSHAVMKAAFREFGFQRHRTQRSLSIGKLGRQEPVSDDTSNWLVNYDWGDNGLRPPFLGCPHVSVDQRAAA